MTSTTLVLDATWRPIGIVPWQQAVVLLLEEKARMVEEYADRLVRSAHLAIPWPAVVALDRHVQKRRRIRFNRQNVLARDGYQCAYCGVRPARSGRPDLSELTLDHVVPRAQAREGRVVLPWSGRNVPVTCWDNVVTSCVACNSVKADRTPAQARLRLHRYPAVPGEIDAVRIALARVRIPQEWREYVPSEWRDYWTAELDAS